MRKVLYKNSYAKDQKLMQKRGKSISKVIYAIEYLAEHGNLPPKYKLHKLIGEWEGAWECHIEPDWLLIFEMNAESIRLLRTGTHSDLFG